jgi:hypothetical protein
VAEVVVVLLVVVEVLEDIETLSLVKLQVDQVLVQNHKFFYHLVHIQLQSVVVEILDLTLNLEVQVVMVVIQVF